MDHFPVASLEPLVSSFWRLGGWTTPWSWCNTSVGLLGNHQQTQCLLYFGIFWGWLCTLCILEDSNWVDLIAHSTNWILLIVSSYGLFPPVLVFFWGGSPCFSKQKWFLQHVSTPQLLGIFQEASHRQGLLIPQLRSATHQGCHPGAPPRLTQPTNQQTNKPSILTTSIPTNQTNKKNENLEVFTARLLDLLSLHHQNGTTFHPFTKTLLRGPNGVPGIPHRDTGKQWGRASRRTEILCGKRS